MESKKCTKCDEIKELKDFVPSNITKSGYRGLCKTCHNAYFAQRRKDKWELVRSYEKKFHYERRLRYEYNTTPGHIESLRELQQNKCAICKQEKKLVIDHCHTEGHVRGLLCSNCNTGLGQLKDNTEYLKAAIEYLEKSRGV